MKIPHSQRLRKGFTLVEMIIYVALSSIILVAMLNAMLAIIENREKTEVISEVQQNMRLSVQRMTLTAYDAIEVATGSTVFDTASGSLVFLMSGATSNPTTYFLSGSMLYVQEGTDDPSPLTSSTVRVSEFSLTNLTSTGAGTTVKIELTASDNNENIEHVYTDSMSLETSFTIRK